MWIGCGDLLKILLNVGMMERVWIGGFAGDMDGCWTDGGDLLDVGSGVGMVERL
jgi:hypothetical protein